MRRVVKGMAAVSVAVLYIAFQWPLDIELRPPGSGWITDRAGRPLSELLEADATRSDWVELQRMPPAMPAAIIAAEDRRFERHFGLDPIAIVRAATQNIGAGRIVSGGSTITQQLARMLWSRPRSIPGKALEAVRAMRLENTLTKAEILEQYLNRAPFGNQLQGVGAAARVYFDKKVETLTPAECAFLAALPRAPGWLNPYRRPAPIQARQQRILRQMHELGVLDESELSLALNEKLALRDTRGRLRAPHFVRYVLSNRESAAARRGVATTLDLELQNATEGIVRHVLAGLSHRGVGNAAVVVLDTRTRAVLAWVGSRDFRDTEDGGQNDGVLALRQPGSALKPFTYLAALRAGFTASSMLEDLPTGFATDLGPYSPSNYDGQFHGPVRLRVALGSSLNVPAVEVAQAIGPQTILDALRSAGFESLDKGAGYYGLALTLGAGEVRLLELTNAYATLADGGIHRPVQVLRDAVRQPGRQALDRRAAALIVDILSDDQARAVTFGEGSLLALPFPATAKTGTSKNFRDNWCVGGTPEITVGVWAGNFSGEPMAQVSGITGAGPIWRQVLQRAMEGRERRHFESSSELETADICPLSGDLPGQFCPSRIQERFVPERHPTQTCAMHRVVRITADGRFRANADCPELGEIERTFEEYPPRFRRWAETMGRPLAPRAKRDCRDATRLASNAAANSSNPSTSANPAKLAEPAKNRLEILSPVARGVYAYDPGIPAPLQKMRMRAVVPPGRKLEWRLNGNLLAQDTTTLDWTVQRGRFRVDVRTLDSGEPLSAAAEFIVK